jgi:gamma-glutamylcyclotransferase
VAELIFAYGSNMCSGRLAAYEVTPFRARGALLKRHKLSFRKRSQDGSGKADVVPSRSGGARVWGVLYEVDPQGLARLDGGEQGYQRRRVKVHLRNGRRTKVWIYVSARNQRDESLHSYTWYKRFLVEGAKEHRLPRSYVASLEGIVAIQDPNRERDRRKRYLICP